MNDLQRLPAIFETSRYTNKVVLGGRDLLIMRSLFESKIISREQIHTQFFPGVSRRAVNKRLRKLVDIGLVARTAIILGRGTMYSYYLTPRGLTQVKPTLAYEVKTESRLSECPLHDIVLNDIRRVFEAKSTVQSYYTENVLQTNSDLQSNTQIKPFIEINSDAMAEINSKVGLLNLAIEFDTTCKSKTRYLNKISAYYDRQIVDGVLYICANNHILNVLRKIDKEVSDHYRCHPRVYLALLGNVISKQDEMTFTNTNGYIFHVR